MHLSKVFTVLLYHIAAIYLFTFMDYSYQRHYVAKAFSQKTSSEVQVPQTSVLSFT